MDTIVKEEVKAYSDRRKKENININYEGKVKEEKIKTKLHSYINTAGKLFGEIAISSIFIYLLTETEEIWKSMCQRKYRDKKPTSNGTWRNLFMKMLEDRDKKLKFVTANISAAMQKSTQERQIKLTHVKSPERPNKRMKYSVPEPKPVYFKESSSSSSSHHVNSFLESNAPSHNYIHKESSASSSHPKVISKESDSSTHKKPKKVSVAPLMSKVKKTVGLLAMKKSYLGA